MIPGRKLPGSDHTVHQTPTESLGHGSISWMARNPVAANLFMLLVFAGGLLGLIETKQEVFPEFDLDRVSIAIPYPGASPAEVEQGILLAVEEAVRGIDGIKSVTSVADEGSGSLTVELLKDADGDKVLSEVQNEVGRITTLPEEAEKPVIKLVVAKRQVIDLVLSGGIPTAELERLAERVRKDLLAINGITQVEFTGLNNPEIHIELPTRQLEALGLSLGEVASRIGQNALESPAGAIKGAAGETMVRVNERRREGSALGDLSIQGSSEGARLELASLGTIRDGYLEDDTKAYFFDGQPALRLRAYRVGNETPTGVSERVNAYAANLKKSLPPTVQVNTWKDNSEILEGRIHLLMKNAALGLVLVLIILALFLNMRLAAWVAVGIPFSFLGALMLMPAADLSINMVTLFAFIITLGLVVDDAIVVGENIYAHMQRGVPAYGAAIKGAREIATPVTFSIFTTIAAFMPLLFVPGVMGKLFFLIPSIVILVLIFSLLESFYVLPAHLAHSAKLDPQSLRNEGKRGMGRLLQRFTLGSYRPFLKVVLRNRWSIVAISIVMLGLSLATIKSGVLPFNFFPKVEDDDVRATLRLPYGSPVEWTHTMRYKLEQGARTAAQELGQPEVIDGMLTKVGEAAGGGGGPAHGNRANSAGSHIVSINVHLKDINDYGISASQFSAAWRRAMQPLPPGAESLTFRYNIGPGAGSDVEVQLSHPDEAVLGKASQVLEQAMRKVPQLVNVENGYTAGKPQLDFTLLPMASSHNLTAREVASQLRHAIYGAEALREQRERREMKVMVRLPEAVRNSEKMLERLRIRTPAGDLIPLMEVARFTRGTAPTTILREDGRRVVSVAAELGPGVRSPRAAMKQLNKSVLPKLRKQFSGLEVKFTGAKKDNDETKESLQRYYLLALVVMYTLLAIPFRSYLQPLIIMSVIPMGLVGAVVGHLIMDYAMSLVSILGFIALSGVVVNDSLILIHAANRARDEGLSVEQSALKAGVGRLRPILLTSLTTFVGLAPMIFETSVQARFLIPMALSLGFGVLFATFVVLVLVPALYVIFTKEQRAIPS
uniref:Acriflavin resistance protein n=1 Tax=Magnetococcus massalia (strain MO-1) TaxID=451514 RepID=A0A1S7LHL1_MAGMO|nr:Conserved membrane protein of unknown function. Putative acriflavin resistance protein. Putative cation/multidrug efflux pump, Acr family [Candidatus Magnetococcus massalia]